MNSLSSEEEKSPLRFDLSMRYRMEAYNGFNAKNYGDNSPKRIGNLNDKLLLQRIIAGFTYEPNSKIQVVTHIQDSRAFGWSLRNSVYPDLFKVKDPNTEKPYYIMNPNEEFFELYDGFVDYKPNQNLEIKWGRQKISYGDYRIFGPGEWGNTGRWNWDALKVSLKKDKDYVDFFAGGTKIHDPKKTALPFTQTEFLGGGIYAHMDNKDFIHIEPFYAHKQRGTADYINKQDIKKHWVGFRLVNENLYHFVLDFNYTKEFGEEKSKNISAFGYFLKFGYQFFTFPLQPIFSLRKSYASGGKKNDPEIKTFDPAYGAQDKFYGWMNLVSWSNLDDREIVLELFPIKGMWIEIKYNQFFIPAPEDVILLKTMKLQKEKNYLGSETDVYCRYSINEHYQITLVVGVFQPGKLQPINGENPRDATWLAFQFLYTL